MQTFIYLFIFYTQVVWVRHRDIHLLTVNQLTYTSGISRSMILKNEILDLNLLRSRYVNNFVIGIHKATILHLK